MKKGTKIAIYIFPIVLIIGVGLYYLVKYLKYLMDKKKEKDANKPKKTSIKGSPKVSEFSPYSILGMIGYYTETSFQNNKLWKDVSVAHNDIKDEMLKGDISSKGGFVVGTTNEGFNFPANVFNDSYTLVYFGKFNGSNTNELITGIEPSDDLNIIYGIETSDGKVRMNGVDVVDKLKISIKQEGEEPFENVLQMKNPPSVITYDKTTFPEGSLDVEIEYKGETSNTTIDGVNGLAEYIVSTVPIYKESIEGSDTITLNYEKTYSVNMSEDTSKHSDFAFKEIIIYNDAISDSQIKKLEDYFRKTYTTMFNTVQGIKDGATTELATLTGDFSESACRSAALVDGAKAFALNLQESKCILYKDVSQLVDWEGDASDATHISICSNPSKKVSKGCA